MDMKFLKEQDDKEIYYHNLSRKLAHSNQSEMEMHPRYFDNANAPRRKASINELSEDEIVFAYNKIKAEKNSIAVDTKKTNEEDLSSEMKEEFLRWMDMKRQSEKFNLTVTSNNKQTEKKVNINDETLKTSNVINVVKSEHEKETAIDNGCEKLPDFEEYKDAISDNEDDDDNYLKVPLVIHEDGDDGKADNTKFQDKENSNDKSLIPTVIKSDNQTESELNDAEDLEQNNTIDVKITLSNSPLEIVTSLSSSSFSLASSDKSLDDTNNNKRPANHSKGRAPLPPAQPIDVIPGHYYDHVTKKHFKETEL